MILVRNQRSWDSVLGKRARRQAVFIDKNRINKSEEETGEGLSFNDDHRTSRQRGKGRKLVFK